MVMFVLDAAAKRERQVLAIFLTVFFLLSCLHLFSGYADNGDFGRSVGFIFEKPEGFASNAPQLNADEWHRRFFNEWHNSWVVLDRMNGSLFSISTYKLYLLIQVGSSVLIGGDASRYSVILGSLPSRLLLLLTFAALVLLVRRRHAMGVAACFALAAAAALLDARWAAFLNSFYEEQMAVIFLPVLALLLLVFAERRSTAWALAVLACATLIGGAKTSYFYLPLLVLPFVLALLEPGRKRVVLVIATCICQALTFAPAALGKYGGINAYHSVYYGALKALQPEHRGAVQFIGEKPVVQACINVSAFDPTGVQCVQAADVRYSDLVRLLVARPSIALDMLGFTLREGQHGIENLGQGMRDTPSFVSAGVFNLYSSLLDRGFNLVVMLLLPIAAAAAVLRRWRGKGVDPMLLAAMLLGVFGVSQYAVALGDGFHEIRKHLIIGNYALVLAFPFLMASFIAMALPGRRLRNTALHVES